MEPDRILTAVLGTLALVVYTVVLIKTYTHIKPTIAGDYPPVRKAWLTSTVLHWLALVYMTIATFTPAGDAIDYATFAMPYIGYIALSTCHVALASSPHSIINTIIGTISLLFVLTLYWNISLLGTDTAHTKTMRSTSLIVLVHTLFYRMYTEQPPIKTHDSCAVARLVAATKPRTSYYTTARIVVNIQNGLLS
jgi:hypothetical protein